MLEVGIHTENDPEAIPEINGTNGEPLVMPLNGGEVAVIPTHRLEVINWEPEDDFSDSI